MVSMYSRAGKVLNQILRASLSNSILTYALPKFLSLISSFFLQLSIKFIVVWFIDLITKLAQ